MADVRISLAGAGPTPVRADAAEQLLRGQTPSTDLVHAAATAAAEAIDPVSDIHGSADYRRTLTEVLTRRCLQRLLTSTEQRTAA